MLARRLSVCVSLVAIGLVTPAPARAQELIDVAALEAQVEAAAELTELPTEPDWGVQDPLNSLPAVSQDAPEVPPAQPVAAEPAAATQAAPAATQAAQAPRYQGSEPQYHREYQAPQADPAPSPSAQPQPAAPPQEAVAAPKAPASPVPEQVPVEPTEEPATSAAPSTPTIWVWIWNWTWVQGSDERYRNSDSQYQFERTGFDQNLTRIMEKIGVQMPVQISVQTGSDIAEEIVEGIAPDSSPMAAVPAVGPATLVPASKYRAPLGKKKQEKREPPTRSVERPSGVPLELAAIPSRSSASRQVASAPREARGSGKPHRARRASPPAPSLPLPGERVGESGAASAASAGMFAKSFAVLIASLMLAAFGRERRLRLPSLRWRGLLGTRTDPPG